MSLGTYNGITTGLSNGTSNGATMGVEGGLQKQYDGTSPNPVLLFDFTQTNFYPNSGTAIVDLSGNNNNGIFVTGTGNGTPTTVVGMTAAANGLPGFYLNSAQNAIRLPEFCKFEGRKPYTICSWVYTLNATGGTYPAAFYSSEGRSGPAIGINFAFDFASNPIKGFLHYRYNQATGAAQAMGLYPTENGANIVTHNKWYFTVARYDGTTMKMDIWIDGKRYSASTPSDASILASSSWSAFGGLRYNNWLYGRCAYFSIYNKDIGLKEITKLYLKTKSKIGV